MPYNKPTLAQLRNRAASEVETRLPEVDPRLRRTVIHVIICIIAGMTYELFGYLDYILRQVFPNSAETEYLEKWGEVWGISRKLATFADGYVHITGTPGTTLYVGTELRRSDGAIYLVADSVIISTDGFVDAECRAEKVGVTYNADAGVKLSFVSPVDGINSEAVITDEGITGGTEREQDEPYMLRILARIQNPPQGGSVTDYIQWALSVPGVTRAWCYPVEMGPGTVTVRFMMDNTYNDGVPHEADITKVYDYISDPVRKPATADLYVTAPIAYTVDHVIAELVPDTPEVRDAISEELKDMYRREVAPGGTVYVSKIWDAVNLAVGTDHFKLVAPADDMVMLPGAIPVMGNVEYA
jgi:uncharacterized phage protein gp47/JayE